MLFNYLKIAFRNLIKQKGYAFINTVGLAVGMGICLFLVLITQYAFTFNHSHEKSDRIYRLADRINQDNGNILDVAITPSPWGEAMAETYEEIEAVVRFRGTGAPIKYGEKAFYQGITYTDSDIFNVFTYPFKYGNPDGALDRPNTIVLSHWMADRYFDDTNPVGEILLVDEIPYEITGVLEELTDHYSFYFNSLASWSSLNEDMYSGLNDWRSHNLFTYFLMSEGADVAALQSKFPEFIEQNVGVDYAARYQPFLQNLEDIYLRSNLVAEHGDTLEISYIYIFGSLGLMILIIAIINFVNLAIAQGMKRAREVGIRKVMGAVKGQLIFQFLAEAFILTLAAVFLAIGFAEIGLPWFNSLTEWDVEANYLTNFQYIAAILGIVLFVGLLAGGYPSFVLSKFTPSAVLKGDNAPKSGKSRLKTALVVTQFTVAIFMIISTLAVDKQIDYLKNKDLGFDQKDLLVTDIPSDITPDDFEFLRDEIFKTVGVEEVSFSANLPGFGSGTRTSFFESGKTREDGKMVNSIFVDQYYIPQFKLTVAEGRNFSSEYASDSLSSIIINETAAREFGFNDPIGMVLQQQLPGEEPDFYTIVGVVEDYHFSTLHETIGPLVIRYLPSVFDELTIRFNTGDLEGTLAQVNETLTNFNAGIPVWNYFLEDDLADTYTTEEVIGSMLTSFTYLTIFIACLGLLGLVSFTIVNKKKEIGIRKVLGASVQSLVQNISYQFVRLVIVGFLIGAPLAYVLIQQWLNSFAYSDAPGLLTFIISGSAIIGVTLLTIGYQTIRAAMANPVES